MSMDNDNNNHEDNDNDDDIVCFSNRYGPPGIGLDTSCQLPFGMIYTPFVSLTSKQNHNHHNHLPDICITCLCYRNRYCYINIKKKTWTCIICGQDHNILLSLSHHQNNNDNDDIEKNIKSSEPITTNPPKMTKSTYVYRQSINRQHQQQEQNRLQKVRNIQQHHQHQAHNEEDVQSSQLSSLSIISKNINTTNTNTIVLVFDQNLTSNEAHCIIHNIQRIIIESMNMNKNTIIHISLLLFGKSISIYQSGINTMTATAYADIYRTSDRLKLFNNHDKRQQQNQYYYYITIDSNSHTEYDIVRIFESIISCIVAFYGNNDTNSDTNNSKNENDNVISNHNNNNTNGKKSRLEMLKERKEARLLQEQKQQQSQQQGNNNNNNNQIKQPSSSTIVPPPQQSPWIIRREQQQQQQQQQQKQQKQKQKQKHDEITKTTSLYSYPKPQYRCTAEAIECAIELASYHNNNHNNHTIKSDKNNKNLHTSRILLFTNGCPNYGKGSCINHNDVDNNHYNASIYNTVDITCMEKVLSYYELIGGKNNQHNNIGIDVFCSSSNELAIPIYHSLVDSSSGYVITIESFSSGSDNNQLYSNLKFILLQTYISSSIQYATATSLSSNEKGKDSEKNNDTDDDTDNDNDDNDNDDIWIDGKCIIDIRMSSFVTPTHLIGPGELIDNTTLSSSLSNNSNGYILPNEYMLYQQTLDMIHNSKNNNKITKNHLLSDIMLESTLIRIKVGRYDTLSSYSMMMQLNDFYQSKYHTKIYIQCIVRYIDHNNANYITQISTYEIPIAKDTYEYVRSANPHIMAVLLGKEAVYRSMYGRSNHNDNDNNNNNKAKKKKYFSFFGNDINGSSTAYHNQQPNIAVIDKLAYEAQCDLDETIFRISKSYRLMCLEHGTASRHHHDDDHNDDVEAAGGGGSGIHPNINIPSFMTSSSSSSMNVAIPAELIDTIRRLYHLRRGPFLCPGPFHSVDDRTILRSQFLRFPWKQCYDMMQPTLWSCSYGISNNNNHDNHPTTTASSSTTTLGLGTATPDTSGSPSQTNHLMKVPYMEQAPAETLALWSNRVIAADYYHTLFVWSGNDMKTSDADHIRTFLKEYLLERSYQRFPMPHIHILYENDSMSRRLTSLLAPSHGDPIEHQIAHYPALAYQLSITEQQQLQSKFTMYDPLSDPSFRTWFWNVTSAIHNNNTNQNSNGNKAESLCE